MSRLILLFILVLTLVACGGGENMTEPPAGETNAGNEGAGETEAEEAGEAEPSGEQVTIRFWMQQDNRLTTAMEGLIASFEEAYPNIDVQLDSFPFAEYHQKISTAFAGNDAPDAFWMDVRTASLAEQGALMPLDDYITEENRNDYLASTWLEPTYEGVTYGADAPAHRALYVNTELAEASSCQPLADAWTWIVEPPRRATQRSGDGGRL